jgi:outer membrane lipoprotein
MLRKSWFVKVLFIAAGLSLAGCVTVPKPIKGNHPEQDLSQIQLAPENFKGIEVRLGGKVLAVQGRSKATTRLEIATQPLDSAGAPILNSISTGRIFAELPNLLEPTDFKNKYVTVLGTIAGVEPGELNGVPYSYIRVNAIGFVRWQQHTRIDYNYLMPPAPAWYYNGRWPYYAGYPGFWPTPYAVMPTQVQQTEYLAPN